MTRRDLFSNALAALAASVLRAPPQIEQALFAYPVNPPPSSRFLITFGGIPRGGAPTRIVLLPAHAVEVVVQ